MNYTDEQFNALAPFEDNFRTAVEGDWTRRVAIGDQHKIKDIYEAATKTRIPFNAGCGSCLLTLLKRAGRMYFADKKARAVAAAKAPAETPAVTPAVAAETPKPEKAPKTAPKLATTDAKPKAKKNYSKKPKTAKKAS